jgi:DNA modification methylase
MKVKIIQGHVLEALKKIPDNSVDCIVTSPPYWGLRKYPDSANVQWNDGWYGQLGLEPTLEMYIEHLLQITAELKRVLKPTGVMFWNHGDCYGGNMGFTSSTKSDASCNRGRWQPDTTIKRKLPAKTMAFQNFRLALRMIDEQGWILRNVIIWHKPNHLPESVKDRFARAYEPIFMFVKSKRYYFNLDAVREPVKTLKNHSFNIRVREAKKGYFEKLGVRASEEEMEKYDSQGRPIGKYDIDWEDIKNDKDSELTLGGIGRFYVWQKKVGRKTADPELLNFFREKGSGANFDYGGINSPDSSFREKYYSGQYLGKNPGDVWTINTEPFPEAHFDTFPTELVRRCIKAGCPDDGIVLDPFVGSGTTIKVAIEERKNAIGIEIVPEYVQMAERRCNLIGNPFIKYEKIIL